MLRFPLACFSCAFLIFSAGCAKNEGERALSKSTRLESPEAAEGPARSASKSSARLIVWITVDQMRGDYLKKYSSHFASGIAWLLNNGRSYQDVHYAHAITETAPGHATLFTGA
jgi:predicted AlkP superfamily pyrophosphatase or phosphodiesterase